MGFGLVSRYINHLHVVTTNKYNTVTDFHTKEHSTFDALRLLPPVFVTTLNIFFIYSVFTIRSLATDFSIGTINVTLQVSLYFSTHKVFKSHIKSSQADFLYSSVLLQLTATSSEFGSLIQTRHGTRITENTCQQSICALTAV
jgi:hypothetical protein